MLCMAVALLLMQLASAVVAAPYTCRHNATLQPVRSVASSTVDVHSCTFGTLSIDLSLAPMPSDPATPAVRLVNSTVESGKLRITMPGNWTRPPVVLLRRVLVHGGLDVLGPIGGTTRGVLYVDGFSYLRHTSTVFTDALLLLASVASTHVTTNIANTSFALGAAAVARQNLTGLPSSAFASGSFDAFASSALCASSAGTARVSVFIELLQLLPGRLLLPADYHSATHGAIVIGTLSGTRRLPPA